jgi:hypothetical protein
MTKLANTGGIYAWAVDREALDEIGVWRQAQVQVIVRYDDDTRPEDDEALSAANRAAWERGEWTYGVVEVRMDMLGLTVTESVGGIGFGVTTAPAARLAWALAHDLTGVALVEMRRQILEISRWAIAAGLGKEEG